MSQRGHRVESARPIRFGTSGWRGILGEEITFDRVRAVVAAAGERIAAARPGARVLVAHDRRFLGERLARTAARVLAGRGLRPVLARGAIPTPVLAAAVRRSRVAGGLIFTASHNPPEYQGLKLFAPSGAGWVDTEVGAVERAAARWLREGPPPEHEGHATADLVAAYLTGLLALLDRDALRKGRLHAVYDALHGAGAGILDEVLRRAGARVDVLRTGPDPSFGGDAPDPRPERLGRLRGAVRALRGRAIGLASDGDADRFAVVDAEGVCVSETDAVALLVDHLARTGRIRRGVAISYATGGLVERVARDHGLRVTVHPLGFKHLSAALLAGEADVAGEESGGFAWAPFAYDKDGILAGALVAELAAGESLRRRLRLLQRRLGASASGRIATPVSPGVLRALERLASAPPERVGHAHVREALCCDGVRLVLDDGFVMFRASGTEPLVRVYADASDAAALERRLRAGLALLRRAARA